MLIDIIGSSSITSFGAIEEAGVVIHPNGLGQTCPIEIGARKGVFRVNGIIKENLYKNMKQPALLSNSAVLHITVRIRQPYLTGKLLV